MSDGIYIAMAGATARAAQLESISDNLSNSQTPGFKKSEPAFQAFLSEAQSPDMSFPAAVRTSFDMSDGATLKTNEQLDVVPNQGTFLAVETAGQVAFTRSGHLVIDADGRLLAAHCPVLDKNGQQIRVPPGSVAPEIRQDGSVMVGADKVGTLATFALSGPLERMGAQLMRPQANGGQATAIDAGVRVGEIELGNSSPLNCAVQLVAAQRHFESAMQTLTTYKKMDERTNELGRVR